MYYKEKKASGNVHTHLWDISTIRNLDGGFGLDKSSLPANLKELPRGTVLAVDLDERVAKVVKAVELAEALKDDAVVVKVKKGSLISSGDVLGIGSKSVEVKDLKIANASFDSFAIEAGALGTAPLGAVLSSYEGNNPVKADGFNSRDVKLLGEDSVSVIYAVDKVNAERLPYPITEGIISDLKQCLILKK